MEKPDYGRTLIEVATKRLGEDHELVMDIARYVHEVRASDERLRKTLKLVEEERETALSNPGSIRQYRDRVTSAIVHLTDHSDITDREIEAVEILLGTQPAWEPA